MFNISDEIEIKGLKAAGIKRAHLVHCLHCISMHDAPKYDYIGKIVSRGTVVIHSCKGDFTVKFDEKNGWARSVEIY